MKQFEVIYQAAGSISGLIVQMDVLKPDHTPDAVQSGVMTEIGTTGRYYKSFDADAENWSIQCSDPNGGKATRIYDKSAYDAHGLTTLVADIQTAVDAVATAIATLETTVTGIDTKVDTIISGVGDVVSACTALASQLTGVETKIDALESPPMIG